MDSAGSNPPEAIPAAYQALADADPAQRAQHVLRLIQEHADGRLELPSRQGIRATLDEINLRRDRLIAGIEAHRQRPPWWNEERQALVLRRADLRGASLRHAELPGALLEEANLAEADLAGADLQGVDLGGADLRGALLEDADLRRAVLRFARGQGSIWESARLEGADLWGADLCRADLSGAHLQGATLEEVNLEQAELSGADLRDAVLSRANLRNAKLAGVDLRGVVLGGTNLEGAVLRDARAEELDLTGCTLTHVHTAGLRLEKTRLEREQLGGAIGEEIAGEYELARKGYLALERNFDELGDHDAARWAYLRRRRMEKRQALRQARAALAEGRWGSAVRASLKAAGDQTVEWVCDYGESVWRVLGALLLVYVVFVPLYGITGTVLRVDETPQGKVKTPTYDFTDLALFSLTAMTAPGNPPEYLLPRNSLAFLLAGTQTLLSIFLTGLMGFVAGNRIRR